MNAKGEKREQPLVLLRSAWKSGRRGERAAHGDDRLLAGRPTRIARTCQTGGWTSGGEIQPPMQEPAMRDAGGLAGQIAYFHSRAVSWAPGIPDLRKLLYNPRYGDARYIIVGVGAV